MKIVTAETMQAIDRRAIVDYGVPGLVLMENAGKRCMEVILAAYSYLSPPSVLIVCGKGNNGGDGYVIGRLLLQRGWSVKVLVLCSRSSIKGDAAENVQRLLPTSVEYYSNEESLCIDDFKGTGLIIDAVFGTGLKDEPKGIYAKAIRFINESGRPVVSVDIPSGVDGSNGRVYGAAVRANATVTFGFPKVGHYFYPGAELAGKIHVVDIGIPPEAFAKAETYDFIDIETASSLVKRRKKDAHKGNFGHLLVIAGSTGKTGAAVMAANSAVRAGSGLVTLAVPASLNHIFEIKTTEAMSYPIPDGGKGYFGNEAALNIEKIVAGKDAVALGPGISWNSEISEMVRGYLTSASLPTVIDADALNAVSDDVSVLLDKKMDVLVITPHPGEMARLSGSSVAEVEADRIGAASRFAARYSVYVILKGARTVIASPSGDIAINSSGNPGMASGGMGDVLTGIVASLLGQGYHPFVSCKLGAFIHGLAADIVASQKGEIGLSATDVQEAVPLAYKSLLERL